MKILKVNLPKSSLSSKIHQKWHNNKIKHLPFPNKILNFKNHHNFKNLKKIKKNQETIISEKRNWMLAKFYKSKKKIIL